MFLLGYVHAQMTYLSGLILCDGGFGTMLVRLVFVYERQVRSILLNCSPKLRISGSGEAFGFELGNKTRSLNQQLPL